ncbi:homocysteine methyltransferase [Fervidicella metallireducens AeB]|uniref:Methionine synthase n=1 Tax=Fervidicella metallireducens AeB TaxID=1403537 RepID=A0A017RVT0_9CLOT|nr:homocysteine methyltransferase [Fervidicella metallireducens AeB]
MKESLNLNSFLLFDGAMGTMLQKYGINEGLPESFNIVNPELIEKIHKDYILSGANIITTNTFGANKFKLEGTNYRVSDIVKRGVEIARSAAGNKLVALDIGPTGKLMEPIGTLSFEEAYYAFKEQIDNCSGADIILIETMSDIYEAKAAVLAAKENCNLPVFCTMTLQKDGRTLTGTDIFTMVNILQGLNVDAIGLNCSMGPSEMLPHIEEMLSYSRIPVIAQPNAGLPRIEGENTLYNITPEEFADYLEIMAKMGVLILGGCCGTEPDYISKIKQRINGLKPVKRNQKKYTTACSSTKTVILGDGVKIIGERINPTGRRKLKEAIKYGDMELLKIEAVKQVESGADILDVNVGLPEIDETDVMKNAVKEIQSVVNAPLQIDSASHEVIEAAVRICNGKPIINSVNGKDEVLDKVLPIVKKYGACVVGLTLDENGIPGSAEGRLRIAEKIIKRAEEYGVDKSNVIIDCLVLTASAQQSEVRETLRALKMIKERLHVLTTLGISNVSFGLPQRELINRTFLAAALAAGVDMPILNPLSKEIVDTINAFNVLWNNDKEAKNFIRVYSNLDNKNNTNNDMEKSMDLKEAIFKGLKNEAQIITENMLMKVEGIDIINNYLIPALDIMGNEFENGRVFLPQLIQSAEAVKGAFKIIKEHMKSNNLGTVTKGKIILATVKGDVHDIGKNIVRLVLENYGFEVMDLGKDVSEDKILLEAVNNDIKIIGLSALMTTTVKSMERTIKFLKTNLPECKIFVGGAVLNKKYAEMIGADYYAKDGRDAVKILQDIFKNNMIK